MVNNTKWVVTKRFTALIVNRIISRQPIHPLIVYIVALTIFTSWRTWLKFNSFPFFYKLNWTLERSSLFELESILL